MTEILPPQIIVFDSEYAALIIKRLAVNGYACLLDSITNRLDSTWFKKELVNDHRIYEFDPYSSIDNLVLVEYTVANFDYVDDRRAIEPTFVIAYGAGTHLSCDDWARIKTYLFNVLLKTGYQEEVEDIMPHPVTEKITWGTEQTEEVFDQNSVSHNFGPILTEGNVTASVPPEYMEVDGEYDYETRYIEKRDTMIYQVTRPGTKKPFTVVTDKFEVKGHKPFFTSLFASNDWALNRYDVCRFDIPFLEQIWYYLKMDGPFEIDRMLKDATEACYPSSTGGPISLEPVVYRHPIDYVVKVLAKRDHGFTEDVECDNLDNLKKRRLE